MKLLCRSKGIVCWGEEKCLSRQRPNRFLRLSCSQPILLVHVRLEAWQAEHLPLSGRSLTFCNPSNQLIVVPGTNDEEVIVPRVSSVSSFKAPNLANFR